MDRFAEKQAQIDRRRSEICIRYPELWSNRVAQWNSPGTEDRAWLIYSANYLFRTGNIRWAIDPLTLNWRVKEAPKVNAARDLKDLSFVLLTHRHADHLDIDLLSALRHLPITWIVPEFMLSMVLKRSGLPRRNIVIPKPLQPIRLHGLSILPFDGLHWESTPDGTGRGVPALGYLVKFNGKRWLFPGDTRTYKVSRLPPLGPVDCLFAPVWLGRGSALLDEPPLLEAFCRFCCALQPRRIVLSHLEEFGRSPDDYWDGAHASHIRSKMQRMSSGISIDSAFLGDPILL